ncbi:hypothetical protein WA026_022685 [Henosepilachna vigintioctopunctata]|uniref:PiggyBac transposable element-derived protein domain-containing protein n=1 Tax=Henosepilachna vigintioctopunctata TaxID=420089 RepID=A0AAW1TRM7_9CUCU
MSQQRKFLNKNKLSDEESLAMFESDDYGTHAIVDVLQVGDRENQSTDSTDEMGPTLNLHTDHPTCSFKNGVSDEELVPFRGETPFRVYMKSKPDKFGLKMWTLAKLELEWFSSSKKQTGVRPRTDSSDGHGKPLVVRICITADHFFLPLLD